MLHYNHGYYNTIVNRWVYASNSNHAGCPCIQRKQIMSVKSGIAVVIVFMAFLGAMSLIARSAGL